MKISLWFAIVEQPPLHIGLGESAIAILTTFIVFYILGPRLLADIRGWFGWQDP